MRRIILLATLVAMMAMVVASPIWAARPPGKRGGGGPVVVAEGGVTDDDVRRSIEKGREWLTNEQANGKWPEPGYWHSPEKGGHSELATMTLLYTGSHPTNSSVMVNSLTSLMDHKLEYTYSVCCRTMAYAYALKGMQSAGPKRDQMKKVLTADAQWLVNNQLQTGDWGYSRLKPRPDFSNTQFAILALWEAAKAGVEIPDEVWRRTLNRYMAQQKADGSWTYGPEAEHSDASEGSMTAAGLATIYICTDMLNLSSGCPCTGGHSSGGSGRTDVDRKIELALKWLDENFTAQRNPGEAEGDWRMYWLYAVERVGLAVGYKYFGNHNWFKEGAGVVIGAQNGDGSWGPEAVGKPLVTTCFAILFLYKGRAPILFNKLQATPGGEQWAWNTHRRDIYNLTGYIEKNKEMQIQWQIVSLKGTVEELHDAPVLYITAETAPKFTADDKKKLREFTDTGGTILFEASCGAPAVKSWFAEFAKEVWPEWSVKPLGPDHGSFVDPYPLKTQRPEILGIDDGVRTCVFYAMDDISCPWQTKALASKEYIFKWGINLFTYATDHSPLRAKLGSRDAAKSEKYAAAVKAGPKAAVSLARVKTDSDWMTNRNYKGLEDISAAVSKAAGLTVNVDQGGVDPSALAGKDAAYLVGSKELKISAVQQQALKDYLAKGGFLWAEAADGSQAFDDSFRKMAKDLGWDLKIVDKTEPLMTGKFAKAAGYDLTTGVQFRRALKIMRLGRPYAEYMGIYQGGKMVGVYSPLDIGFAATPYEAYGCRGYLQQDAVGVASNILLYISDR